MKSQDKTHNVLITREKSEINMVPQSLQSTEIPYELLVMKDHIKARKSGVKGVQGLYYYLMAFCVTIWFHK